jgi:dTDP-glucose 4,6-dehydratase
MVTGGAGFIGSNFIHLLLEETDYSVLNVDCLTYSGNLDNLRSIENNPRYTFSRTSINDRTAIESLLKKHSISGIIHFAAESHVDRSIESASPFFETNVMGTLSLLEAARSVGIERFVHISTDEVYGTLGAEGFFTEETPLAPNSPYSSSKASSDLLVRSFVHTHNFPALITRCSNNYGPYQFPEKLIPRMIDLAMQNKKLPVYGNGMNIRDWIYVKDHNKAVLDVFEKGKIGTVYNIGGLSERTNIDVVTTILSILGKDTSSIEFVEDRKGHDFRYAIDTTFIQNELQWKPEYTFEIGLEKTVEWYVQNQQWLENIQTGRYQQ